MQVHVHVHQYMLAKPFDRDTGQKLHMPNVPRMIIIHGYLSFLLSDPYIYLLNYSVYVRVTNQLL